MLVAGNDTFASGPRTRMESRHVWGRVNPILTRAHALECGYVGKQAVIESQLVVIG